MTTMITRLEEITLSGNRLAMPVFFPSVSTVKTALAPSEYLATLHSLRDINQQFLVSAFDLGRSHNGDGLKHWLTAAQDTGATVLMDSGNYESYWKDEQVSWRQADFHEVLRRFPCTFAFGFDEQNPPADADAHVGLVVERWRQDQIAAGDRVIVPIVHGTPESLPELCRMPASLCPERHEGPRRGVNLLLVQPSRCCVTSQARSSAQWTETGCAGVPS